MRLDKLILVSASVILSAVPALSEAVQPCGSWTGPEMVALGSDGGVNQYGCGEYRQCIGPNGQKWMETRAATGCADPARPQAEEKDTGEAIEDRPPGPPNHGEEEAGVGKPPNPPKRPVTEEVETQDPNKRIK